MCSMCGVKSKPGSAHQLGEPRKAWQLLTGPWRFLFLWATVSLPFLAAAAGSCGRGFSQSSVSSGVRITSCPTHENSCAMIPSLPPLPADRKFPSASPGACGRWGAVSLARGPRLEQVPTAAQTTSAGQWINFHSVYTETSASLYSSSWRGPAPLLSD